MRRRSVRLARSLGPSLLAPLAMSILVAAPALAVRWSPDGLRAGPAAVYLTRTITVSVAVEDTSGHGADVMEVGCVPEPSGLVRAVGGKAPPAFTCTAGGSSAGWYGWEAIREGVVRFRVTVSLLVCETGAAENLETLTPPVTLMPVPMDSTLEVSPRYAGPGDTIEIVLNLRNRAPEWAVFGRPGADVEMIGRVAPPAQQIDGPVVDPAGILEGEHMVLPAGSAVRVIWHFRAVGPGDVTFRVAAAGLIMMTKPVTIRQPAVLDLAVPAPAAPSAVGRTFAVRADLRVSGDTGAREAAARLSWSPPEAARLVAATLSGSVLEPSGPPARAAFTLELLKAGPLMLTVSAGGREADTGRRIEAAPVTRLLAVQAPPELGCVLELSATPALAGSRLPVRIGVVNRSKNATQGLTPLLVVREGTVTLEPFMPLYQGVPPGATAWFTGALTLDEPGPVEIAAQVTGRGDRGGEWITITSEPARLLSVARPRLLLFALSGDVWEGASATVRFVLGNGGPDDLRLTTMTIGLSASSGVPLAPVRPVPLPLRLGAGASATLAFTFFPPATKAAYEVTGLFSATGAVTAHRLPFTVQLPSRPLADVRPRTTRINDVQPDDAFRPPMDPLLLVDWTSTMEGELGVAVMTPAGRLVGILRPLGAVRPGRFRELWRGDLGPGRWVAPGSYLLRLAGPSGAVAPVAPSSTTAADSGPLGWPGDAAWHQDRAFQVAAP